MIHPNTAVSAGKMARLRRQQGATLLEVAFYLVLAALVLFALYRLYDVTLGETKAKGAAENVVQIAQKLRGRADDVPAPFTGLNNALAVQSGAVPQTMYVAATPGTITNTYSKAVTIAADNYGGLTGDSFSITTLMPPSACPVFLSNVRNAFARITVSGTVVKNALTGDWNITQADQAACNAQGSADVTIILTQGR